ncbi:MAG: hypothetical protein JWR39_1759 [Devosia sp.]|nr:hypothetical protein [Devosia sp.]
MLKRLSLVAITAACLIVPAYAQTIDPQTDLMLRCGAGYLLIADDETIAETAEDKETFTNFGNHLITLGDQALAADGMSESARADLGYRIMSEVDSALENGTDAGFEPEECLALLESEQAKITGDQAGRDKRIDMLMTCGAGFIVSAEAMRAQGNEADAAMLEELGTNQINAAEDLMIEAGMNDDARFQVSKLYGEQVGTKMKAGDDLAYDWDTCAALEH